MAINTMTVEGRFIRPEMRFTPSGKAILTGAIIYDHRGKDAKGNWDVKASSFFDIEVWGRDDGQPGLPDMIADLPKGTIIQVQGTVRKNYWEDKDGGRREKTILTVHSACIPMISPKTFHVDDETDTILFTRPGKKDAPVDNGIESTLTSSQYGEEPF